MTIELNIVKCTMYSMSHKKVNEGNGTLALRYL